MRIYIFILLFFYLVNNILSISEGVFFPTKDNIIILTDYTFEEAFLEYQYLFISIYSEICFSCIHYINPSLSKLYQEINTKENDLKNILSIAKIDASFNHYFVNKYNILGYPVILLFEKGKLMSQLLNKFEVDDMLFFLKKNILRPIQYINNIIQYNKIVKNSFKESVITYFGNNINTINSLINVSNTFKHLTFINIYNSSLIKALNNTEGDLSINKFFDEPKITKKNESVWTYEKINNFIKKYNHKILIDFSTKEGENFIKHKKNILLLIIKQKINKEQLNYNNEIRMNDISKSHKKNFLNLARQVRDKIQGSYMLYKINYNYGINDNKKRRSILDEDDPFGFEYQRQQMKECEIRQIKFIEKLNLDKDIYCEIRLIFFEKKNDEIKYYKFPCGGENIENNVVFINKWYNKSLKEFENKYEVINN